MNNNWAYPPPYQSGVGLSGTLSTPLSLRYVQTTPTIPYARNEQTLNWSKNYKNYYSMNNNIFTSFFLTLLISLATNGVAVAQATIRGVVTDAETGETLIGASILIDGTITGTITDFNGNYSLKVRQTPATLTYSYTGYETIKRQVTGDAKIDVAIGTSAIMKDEVVVSASRVEESILQSPVTIEKLDLIAIQQSASADYYDEITKLKGVHNTQASLTFNSINARGFAGHGNTRFVQLQDGMDNAAPLLNFPTGNIVGISELDIKSVELIPGASSALYGPNAFNGILLMESKDPFIYQGLSVQLKSGVTEGSLNSDPFYGGSIRYAKAFNDKLAFKVNFSGLLAKDWDANDYDGQRSPTVFGNSAPGDPTFDGINVYGDESLIPVAGGVRRTGWTEQQLQESRAAESFKYDAALHYRITDNLEANVSYKYGTGSSVYQGSERYALRGLVQQFAKVELNSDKWNIRAYRSMTDDGDSYNMTALGAFANEALFPSAISVPESLIIPGAFQGIVGGWAAAYSQTFDGAFALFGIPGGDHDAAREFADNGGFAAYPAAIGELFKEFSGLPDAQADFVLAAFTGSPRNDAEGNPSPEAEAAIEAVRSGLFQKGGAGFIDDSNLNHVEGNYDLTSLVNDVVSLQIGANYRLYDLYTAGTIFNEDPDGDGVFERIKIGEYGGYLQASKSVLNEQLKLTGSVRYDKNQNFEGQFSPRVSMVYSIGEKKQHNIRASYQTGFRNPTTQGQYIYFPTTSILLGGTRENAERYGVFEGGAWSEDSYLTYLSTGDDADLRDIYLDYVQPEKLQSIDIGYKGITNKKLFIDVNGYYSIYKDFIQQDNVYSKEESSHQGNLLPAGTVFRPYFNAPIDVNAFGITGSLDYVLRDNWKLGGNYSYNDFSFDTDNLPTGFEGFDPGFNTPKHKINVGLSNRKIAKNLSFGVNLKWQDEFYWFGSFGEGMIPSYYAVDAQIGYRIPKAKTTIKLGVNNLTNNNYITNYGAAIIGRMSHITITYDQFSN